MICAQREVALSIGPTGEAIVHILQHLILSLAVPRAAGLTRGSPSP